MDELRKQPCAADSTPAPRAIGACLMWKVCSLLTAETIIVVGSDYGALYRNAGEPTDHMVLVVESSSDRTEGR